MPGPVFTTVFNWFLMVAPGSADALLDKEAIPHGPSSRPVRLLRPVLWAYVMWVITAVTVLTTTGILPSGFIAQWGPAMRAPVTPFEIKTATEWWLVAVFTFLNHLISTFAGSVIDPWITTHVNNADVHALPWSRFEVHVALGVYWVAGWIDYVLFLMISLSRFDFLAVGIVADVISKQLGLRVHMDHKTKAAERGHTPRSGHLEGHRIEEHVRLRRRRQSVYLAKY